ncbi:MYND-type domain-containing protein [Haematococcus lacustris]|uniref:MYND-type domain-containing protein n=1 Tax=Haematococcus lacustris TaxID=44745 RepID=A0A699Z7H5_HAELA|nr:MYND-type domain-containing protein [Haematococcus lacustris]
MQPFAELPAALWGSDHSLCGACSLCWVTGLIGSSHGSDNVCKSGVIYVQDARLPAAMQEASPNPHAHTLPFNSHSEMLGTVLAMCDGGGMGGVLKADFVAWAQLGSLRGHQEQQWSKSTAKSAVVNCTMLPPFQTPVPRWIAHYDQQFMHAWAPLELHELQAVARPDQLASALQAAATAASASPDVEEAPLPGPWGAFPPCPAPPVDKAGARPEYRPALVHQTYKAGMLARACMVRMAAACVAMQHNARLGGPGEVVPMQQPPAGHGRPGDSAGRSGVPAQLCFWLGDCLQLCQGPDLEQHWAHRPAAQPTVVRAPQQAHQEQPFPQPAVQPPLMFHVIDTSNVADHAGLFNLLLAAQPRLVPHPLARLITCSMTWTMSFKSMREYLQSCLSCPPSMYPTLLGLRLATDITAGRPQPLGIAALLRAIGQDPRPLVWSKSVAAVGTAALTQTLMLGQQQLMAAGRLPCLAEDPQPGPGLAGEPSRAMTQVVPAVEVLAPTPGLALTGANGCLPRHLKIGGKGAKVAASHKDSLEHHLEEVTRSCTPQVRQACMRGAAISCKSWCNSLPGALSWLQLRRVDATI